MGFFFFADGKSVPWAFKLCGVFQFACDIYLGGQSLRYGEGSSKGGAFEGGIRRMNGEKDVRLA